MRSLPVRLGAAVFSLGLLAAACGSDDDASSTATTAAAAETTAAASETTKKADAPATTAAAATADKDIIDTAVGAGDFKTLAAALTAAGLVDTLKGPGPFTVFAPTDAAFKALPAGTVEDLLKPENKAKLTSILTYHVVSGNVMAADVVKLTEAKTVQGANVKIKVEGSNVLLNDKVKVTKTDIKTKNGVIHVIDAVLMPPA